MNSLKLFVSEWSRIFCRPSFCGWDVAAAFVLLSWTLLLALFGIGELEYFRHTEADRVLIAWDMVQNGNYLVPHILQDPILTKPPLFYWAVSATILIFDSVAEWVGRVPSAVAAALCVVLQYVFFRLIGASIRWALLSAFLVSTGSSFLVLSTLAEIDMLFGFLCFAALGFGFFAVERRSLALTLLAYSFVALGFLCKWIPVVLFFAAAQILYLPLYLRLHPELRLRQELSAYLQRNCFGVLLFLALVSAWLLPFGQAVGWQAVLQQFEVELLQRVVEESSRNRGVLYYFKALFVSAAPWSLVFACLCIGLGSARIRARFRTSVLITEPGRFFVYSALVVLSALVMLTLAEGKSHRYFFPVYGFVINLCLFSLLFLRHTYFASISYRATRILCLILAILLPCIGIFVRLPGVSQLMLLTLALGFALELLLLSVFMRKRCWSAIAASTACLFLIAKLGYVNVYAAHRNETRSVKPIASKLDGLMLPGSKLYTLNMFERWVVYYLKRNGRDARILSKAEASRLASASDEPIYVLLSFDQERFHFNALQEHDPEFTLVADFRDHRDRLVLVRVSPKTLAAIL